MNKKQKRFADEYLIDLNATQAAIRAGYSEKSAYSIGNENLRKPEIEKYIKERLKEKENALIADQDEIMKFLTAGMRQELCEEVIVPEGSGMYESEAITKTKKIGLKDSIKCAELLGKRYGLYTEKIEADVDAELNIKIDYGDE